MMVERKEEQKTERTNPLYLAYTHVETVEGNLSAFDTNDIDGLYKYLTLRIGIDAVYALIQIVRGIGTR